MCGLVGIFGKALSITQEKVFRDLLYLDVFRGEHSTGAAIVSTVFNPQPDSVETVEVVKAVGPAPYLFEAHGKYQGKTSLSTKTNLKVLLGHNRHATQGAVSIENAHPFEIGNVVGAHNGTVPKYSLKTLHEADKFEVDSQMIYSHLGAGNPINDIWEVADGAMALTWYDKAAKKLNIIRNKERPLYVSKTKDGKNLYWASESWMIWIATSRNGVKEIEDPVAIDTDKLYQFSLGEDGSVVSEETPIPPFVRKPVVTSYNGYKGGESPWSRMYGGDDDDWQVSSHRHQVSKTTQDRLPIHFVINEIVKDDFYPHAFGKTLDGEDIKIVFTKANAKVQTNNVLQRGKSKGFYTTNKYFRVYGAAPQNKMLTCQYVDTVYCKKNSLTEGYFGEVLTSDEYTKRVKCGCCNCNTVPSWKSRGDLRWIAQDMFLCYSCKDLSWVKDLEDNIAT